MTSDEFKKKYWDYYLILERDLINIQPYVSFHQDNFNCFSNEFIKLYQAICSEIDVVCKQYCNYLSGKPGRDINDYRTILLSNHSEIASHKVDVRDMDKCILDPWRAWNEQSNNKSPLIWWTKYNKVKHQRTDKDGKGIYNYQHANLENVLNALAGLYILEKLFYRDLIKQETSVTKCPNYSNIPISSLFLPFEWENTISSLINMHSC